MAKFRSGDLVLTSTQRIIQGTNTILDATGVANFTSLEFDTGATISEFSIDPALTDDSDSKVSTQKAVRSYVDSQISGTVPTGTDESVVRYNGLNSVQDSLLFIDDSGNVTGVNDLIAGGTGDFEGHVAIGNDSVIHDRIVLRVQEDINNDTGAVGINVNVDNASNNAAAITTAISISMINSSTSHNILAGESIYVASSNNSGATVTEVKGVDITAGVTGDNTTIATMIGGEFNILSGFSMVNTQITDAIAGKFQLLNLGSGGISITNGYGVLIKTPGFNPSGTTDNLYGLYIEDQSTVGFTTDYNLYSAGVNSLNKFEGSLILATGASVNEFSVDGTLAGDSDDAVPTEKAVKTYVDAQIGGGVSHNSTTGLQGGDSTSEFYHLTQSIHDGLFSASPTIGLGDPNGVHLEVDYGASGGAQISNGSNVWLDMDMDAGVGNVGINLKDYSGGGIRLQGFIPGPQDTRTLAIFDPVDGFEIGSGNNQILSENTPDDPQGYIEYPGSSFISVPNGKLYIKDLTNGGSPAYIFMTAGTQGTGPLPFATGNYGPQIDMVLPPDFIDGTSLTKYTIKVHEDDFNIGPSHNNLSMRYSGYLDRWSFSYNDDVVLKTINNGIEISNPEDLAVQDYSTYTEVDTGSDLSIVDFEDNGQAILYLNVPGTEDAYVYEDFGASFFGDCSFKFGEEYDSLSSGHEVGFWAISNTVGTIDDIDTANSGILVYLYNNGATLEIRLKDLTNDNEDSLVGIATDDRRKRYMIFDRTGTTATLEIYIDRYYEELEDTLTITCSTTEYRYLYGFISSGDGTSNISRGRVFGLNRRISEASNFQLSYNDDSDDFFIGPDTDPDALKYVGATQGWEISHAGSLVISTDTTGIVVVGSVRANDLIVDGNSIQLGNTFLTEEASGGLAVDGNGDFSGHMAFGADASITNNIVNISEDGNEMYAFGWNMSYENLFSDAGAWAVGMQLSLSNSTSTAHSRIVGINLVASSSNNSGATVTDIRGIIADGGLIGDDSIATTVIGGDFGAITGSSMVNSTITNAIAGQFYLLRTGSGDVDIINGYGVLVKTPGFNPTGTTTNLYGLYIEDQSTVGFTTDYNLYSAGVNSRNKIEGTLEIESIDTTALVISGDIYCDELFTSGSTINVGTGQIKSTAGNIELYNSGSKTLSTGIQKIQIDSSFTPGNYVTIESNLNGAYYRTGGNDATSHLHRFYGNDNTGPPGAQTLLMQMNWSGGAQLYFRGVQSVSTTVSGITTRGSGGDVVNWVTDANGNGIIAPSSPSTGVIIKTRTSAPGAAIAAQFLPEAAVELYYNGVKKFETTLTGATITGDLAVSQVTGLDAPAALGEAIRQTANVTEVNLNILTGGGETTLHSHASVGFAAGTKMYFYQDTVPVGWTIDVSVPDTVLSVKGGSAAYNVAGGSQGGTWSQPNHNHTTGSHILTTGEIPSHNHRGGIIITNAYSDFSEYGRVASTNPTGFMSGNYSATPFSGGLLYYTSTEGGGGSHNHGSTDNASPANTWRPLAAIGIICTKN